MRDRPDDLDEGLLRPALARHWSIDAVRLDHMPVGFGDHHWAATGHGGRRWFVTVADVRRRPYERLRQTMDTAAALREEAGLGFVVAPLRAAGGSTLLRLGHRYAVSVFPYEEGVAGDFGDEPAAADRAAVIDLLAELHATPPPSTAPARPVEPAGRALLEELVRPGSPGPWLGGPYAEPARELVSRHAATLRRALGEFDRLAAGAGEPVLTHGEPHPGNVLRAGRRTLLVDWDTVGTAPPERDLWHVVRDADDLSRYAAATGRTPDPDVLALYRLRWALDDVADFVAWFRAPHARTPDTELAWRALAGTLDDLA